MDKKISFKTILRGRGLATIPHYRMRSDGQSPPSLSHISTNSVRSVYSS